MSDDERAAEALRAIATYVAGGLTFAQMRREVDVALRDPETLPPARPSAPCPLEGCTAPSVSYSRFCRVHAVADILRR